MKIETPILKRLGPIPFWRGERRCLDALEEIYRRAAEKAEQFSRKTTRTQKPRNSETSHP